MGQIKNIKLHIVTDIKLSSLTKMSRKCCMLLHHWTNPTTRMALLSSRNLSTCSVLNKKASKEKTGPTEPPPRVLPVVHQIANEHNSQYFTPYPQLTREEMEEPAPPVSAKVRKILELSRPSYDGFKYVRPPLAAKKFRELRKKMVREGHHFPPLPLQDLFLEPMPAVEEHVLKKEERLKNIEECMAKMPALIAEYKENRRQAKEDARLQRWKSKSKEWEKFQEKRGKAVAATKTVDRGSKTRWHSSKSKKKQ